MIHLSLFQGGGRFSGLVGGAYGRCSTATNPTTPTLDFSYTSQSAADLGAAAHGPIKKWGRQTGFRATPRATASWAGLRDRYAQRGLSPVVRFGACSYELLVQLHVCIRTYMYRLLYMDDSRNRACSTPTAFSSRFYRTVLFWLPLAGTKYEPITKSCS